MDIMAMKTKTLRAIHRTKTPRKGIGVQNLSMKTNGVVGIVKALEKGLPYQALERFQKESSLATEAIAKILRIPPRTWSRRKAAGKLTGPESERLVRLVGLYEKAVSLFEGDSDMARTWLGTSNRGLGRLSPLTLAETELGARAVEDLIGRLEHGVYS
jgi:putative toxin-antitoxin system antitoxin component (TIGR02293 family)